MELKNKECHSTSCPFAFTDESEQIQNYGCLPTPTQIIQMRIKSNKTWACHSNDKKPCLGALQSLKEKGLPFKVIDINLVTEASDWTDFI